MAIKDQCFNCIWFEQSSGICSKTGVVPQYDNHSCDSYSRKGGNINLNKGGGIDLSKAGDIIPPRVQQPAPIQHPRPTPVSPVAPPPSQPVVPCYSGRLFAHPFSFNGRIRRLEYNLSYLIYLVWYGMYMALVETDSVFLIVLCLISLIPAIWFYLAQAVKRCHDRDNSGFYILIPFYGLWLMFAEGDSGTNNYGSAPKI